MKWFVLCIYSFVLWSQHIVPKYDLKDPGVFLTYMRSHSYNVSVIASSILENELSFGTELFSSHQARAILEIDKDIAITPEFLEKAKTYFSKHDYSKIQLTDEFIEKHKLKRPYIIERLAAATGVEVRDQHDLIGEWYDLNHKDGKKSAKELDRIKLEIQKRYGLAQTIDELNVIDNIVAMRSNLSLGLTLKEAKFLQQIEHIADMVERSANPYSFEEFGHRIKRPSEWIGKGMFQEALIEHIEKYFIDNDPDVKRYMSRPIVGLEQAMKTNRTFFKTLRKIGIDVDKLDPLRRYMIPIELSTKIKEIEKSNPIRVQMLIKENLHLYISNLPKKDQQLFKKFRLKGPTRNCGPLETILSQLIHSF